MAGTVVIIVVLAISPVLILMGSTLIAVVLGWAINDEVDKAYEGSELLALAYPAPASSDS